MRFNHHNSSLNMKTIGPIAIGLSLVGLMQVEAKPWTDIQGRVIEADFVSADLAAGKAKLRLANGTEPTIDLAKLSEADRTWVTDFIKKEENDRAAIREVQLKNAGKTVHLKSDGAEAVTYHVYYPTSFDPAKPPAMIIMSVPAAMAPAF